METGIGRLKVEKQNAERTAVRQKLIDTAKQHGFEISELFGRVGLGGARSNFPSFKMSLGSREGAPGVLIAGIFHQCGLRVPQAAVVTNSIQMMGVLLASGEFLGMYPRSVCSSAPSISRQRFCQSNFPISPPRSES